MNTDLEQSIENLTESWEGFKKTNDERLKKIEKGESTAELETKLEKIEKDLDKFLVTKQSLETKEITELQERIDLLEAARKTPGITKVEKIKSEYKDLFVDWIRSGGQNPDVERKARAMVKQGVFSPSYAKDVTIGTTTEGGFALPEEIAREIDKLERQFSNVRDSVRVRTVSTNDYKELVTIGGATSGWVGETGTRTATATSAFRERAPTMGELYAYPQASEWSLDDLFFNVEQWIAEEVGETFAVDLDQAVVDGNGTTRPTGILNGTPVATSDTASPLRSAEVIQFIEDPASPVPTGVTGDGLIDLVYATNSRYRARAKFVMNSLTTGAVRRIKDTTDQYLWAPGLAGGQPTTLLGYAVSTWEQMPDVGANAFPVIFGDLIRGYTLADRVGMRITRDNVTNVGFVRFYVRRRIGGILTNNNAIKTLRTQ